MKIFIDSANIDEILACNDTGLVDGVTTNPTLIKRAGGDYFETIAKIAELCPKFESISAEVVADTAVDMLRQAEPYWKLDERITIKVPLTVEGLKACKVLSDQGIKTNVTLCFSVAQAIMAAKAGATYVSPFVGRLNDQYWDGITLIEEIADLYATHCVKTQVLAASIREVRQVPACFRVGADVCTLPYDIFQKLYDHTLTDSGLAKFDADWKALKEKL